MSTTTDLQAAYLHRTRLMLLRGDLQLARRQLEHGRHVEALLGLQELEPLIDAISAALDRLDANYREAAAAVQALYAQREREG
jgi:uncharacterized protein involved in exopolysaccharide biosynthesis